MDLSVKKDKLALIEAELLHVFCEVKNIGSVFFVTKKNKCVLRDLIYTHSKSVGLYFEVLVLDGGPYFVGTKDHATALFSALGGSYSPSEYCHSMTHHMSLWIWTAPKDMQVLDVEDAKIALF